jgi:hypothetical protein
VEALDRYLEAVRGYLPRAQRADIVAELAEDLRSEIEERQAAAGRALSEGEVMALLKQRGHPMAVAERFLPFGIFCLVRVVQQAQRALGRGPRVKAFL